MKKILKKLKKEFKNLKKVLFSPGSLLAIIVSMLWIGYLFYCFNNSENIIWNMWYAFYIIELALKIWITILFWLFIWSTFYKIMYFSKFKKRHIWIWWFASFFWILASWCPACSISIASYLWLTGIISTFPFSGIELKVLSFMMLLYVVYATLSTLEVCKIKK